MSCSEDFNSLLSFGATERFSDSINLCISLAYFLLLLLLLLLLFCSILGSMSLLSGTAHQGCSDWLHMTNHIMTPMELCCFKISWVTVCYEYILIPMSCEQMCSHSLSWAICCFIFVPGLISVRLSSLPDKMCIFFTLTWDQIFQEPEVLLWHL